jgi:hypothetical protein
MEEYRQPEEGVLQRDGTLGEPKAAPKVCV